MDLPAQTYAPVVVEQEPYRCAHCNRMLAELLTAPWRIKCSRCGALNWATAEGTVCAEGPERPDRIKPSRRQSNGDLPSE